VLHILFLIVCGLILTGWLSGILEQLGLRNHYWALLLAAVLVFATAWTHSWKRLVIALVVATVYVGLRRDLEIRAKRKSQKPVPESYVNSGGKP
jgi:hypothetical protein